MLTLTTTGSAPSVYGHNHVKIFILNSQRDMHDQTETPKISLLLKPRTFLNVNCLGQCRGIRPWIHRGSTLITWRWLYITWRWCHRNHANTITSVIAAKQTVINEVYVFSIKYRYSYILLKNTLTSFILLIKLFGQSEKWILIGLNPHATCKPRILSLFPNLFN